MFICVKSLAQDQRNILSPHLQSDELFIDIDRLESIHGYTYINSRPI